MVPPFAVIGAVSFTRLKVSLNAIVAALAIVCGALSVIVVPLIAVTVGVPATPVP